MAFHGALIGVILAIWLFLRKHRSSTSTCSPTKSSCCCRSASRSRASSTSSTTSCGARSAIPISRGASRFPNYTGYRHPSQIFEGILDILVLPIVLLLYRRRPADGVVAWTWFTLYGVTRSIAEIWREPGFTVVGSVGGPLAAMPQIFIGAGLLIWAIRRGKHSQAR